MTNIKNNKIVIAIGALSVITLIAIIYAAFTVQLTINGTANVRDSKWDIHIVEEGQLDPTNITGSAKVLTKPTASTTSISDFALSLTTPGDTIEYTFNVINEGDYDAEISTLTKNGVTCTANGSTGDPEAVKVCNKLEYTLKYDNGSNVDEGDTLLSKETKTMKLTIKYQEFDDPTQLPTTNVSISGLGIDISYSQSGNAKVNGDGTTPYVAPQPVYSVGDRIQVVGDVSGDYYRVIADSGSNQDYVVALKENPLTVSEVNTYGAGHVNMYSSPSDDSYYHQASYYGGMAYYSSVDCGYANPEDRSSHTMSGCINSYANSEIKYVVDAWSQSKIGSDKLVEVDGYKSRLITKEEYENISEYSWRYNTAYTYWTMSAYDESSSRAWEVAGSGKLFDEYVTNARVVRPVINVYKSAIQAS